MENLHGSELQLLKLADIVKAPAKWREFVLSTSAHGQNWRELTSALTRKYLNPHEAAKDNRHMMQQSYEIREHLWDIETLLSPTTLAITPKAVLEVHDTILLHKRERLETLQLFLKDPRVASEFHRLVQATPPSKSKDLEKVEREAEKEVRKRPQESGLKSQMKKLGTLAHTSRTITSRPFPAISLSAQPPRARDSTRRFFRRGIQEGRPPAK